MMQLRVEVQEKHIKNGVKQDPCKCPIALALREQHALEDDHQWAVYDNIDIGIVREEKELSEDGSYDWFTDNSYKRIKPMPELLSFLNDFDEGKHVDPFVFVIEYPDDSNHGVARHES